MICLCVAVCLATILNHILLVRIAVATTSKWKKGMCLFEWQTLIQPPSCCSHHGIDNNRCACLRNCAFPKCNRPATDQQKFNQTECRKALKVSGPSYAFQRSQKGRTADAITDDATTTSAFVWIDVIFTTKVGADRFVTHSTASHVVIIAQYEWWLQRDVVDNGPFFALHNRVKYDRSIVGPRLPILWSKNREQKSQKRAHDAYPPTTTTFYYFFFVCLVGRHRKIDDFYDNSMWIIIMMIVDLQPNR